MTTDTPETPGPSPRVARKRDRRIRQVLAVAAAMFGEHGYDGVSLDDVAARLDVTKGSLYYYFSGKDDLATAAIEALGSDWLARLERLSAAHTGSQRSRLRALLHEHITIAVCDHPEALRMFLVPRAWPVAEAARIRALRRRHDAVFRDVVRAGVASGEFTVVSVDVALQCMHAAMTQAPAWCAPLPPASRVRAIDELTDTLLRLVT